MRQRAARAIMVVGLVCLLAGLAEAQVKKLPQAPQKPDIPTGQVKIPTLAKRPDLVPENFSVNVDTTVMQGRRIWFPVTLTVKNTGSAPVDEDFYVGYEFIKGTQGNWTPDRNEDNTILVSQSVAPGQSVTVSGYLKIDTAILSDSTIQVRAAVDTLEFEEFPPEGGRIAEVNENNNFSNGVTIQGPYTPDVTGIDKTSAVKGMGMISLSGTGFGSPNPDRTVIIEKDSVKTAAVVNQWTEGVIIFRVPQSAPTGNSIVYIGDKNTLGQLSQKDKDLLVLDRRQVTWEKITEGFNTVFHGGFSIRLHTWSGSSTYENVSEMKVLGNRDPVSVQVPRVQFKTDVGYYRFLVNDLNSFGLYSDEPGFSMNRDQCAPNQLRLVVRFESEGKELIGYYKVLGPAGKWRRTGAPDIEVNNAQLGVLFQFVDAGGGNLDYQAAVTFSGNVSASGNTWNKILNLFMSGWNTDLKREVQTSVRAAVNQKQTRDEITASLKNSILFLAGLGSNNTVTGYGFTNEGIQITYY